MKVVSILIILGLVALLGVQIFKFVKTIKERKNNHFNKNKEV